MAIEAHVGNEFTPPTITHSLIRGLIEGPPINSIQSRVLMVTNVSEGQFVRGGDLVDASQSINNVWLPAEQLGIDGILERETAGKKSLNMELLLLCRANPDSKGRDFYVVLKGDLMQAVTPFFSHTSATRERKVTRTYTLSPDGETTVSNHWLETGYTGFPFMVGEVIDEKVSPDFWENARALAARTKNEKSFEAQKKAEEEKSKKTPENVFDSLTNSDAYYRLLDIVGIPPAQANGAHEKGIKDIQQAKNQFMDSIHARRTIPLDPSCIDQMHLVSLFDPDDPQLTLTAKRPYSVDQTYEPQIVLEGNKRVDTYIIEDRTMRKIPAKRIITLASNGYVDQYFRAEEEIIVDGKPEVSLRYIYSGESLPYNFWGRVCEATLSLSSTQRPVTAGRRDLLVD